jgi:hypothetical protein
VHLAQLGHLPVTQKFTAQYKFLSRHPKCCGSMYTQFHSSVSEIHLEFQTTHNKCGEYCPNINTIIIIIGSKQKKM